jgi:hypothetical protein
MTLKQLQLLANVDEKSFRSFTLETTGGNYITVNKPNHVAFPPPDFDLITVFAADGLVHYITLETINSWAVL